MPKRRPRRGGDELVKPDAAPPRDDATVALSLKFFDHTAPFTTNAVGPGHLLELLDRLRDVCRMPVAAFRQAGKSLRSHPIAWGQTIRPRGFGPAEQAVGTGTAWQFSISANEHGRVHGLLESNVFHVVWLDPDHRLYP